MNKIIAAVNQTKQFAAALLVLSLFVLALAAFYGYGKSRLAQRIFEERLLQLSTEHEQLKSDFNEAVRRTAVTELMVSSGKLEVVVRTATGTERVIATPYDPAGEIYVDFVVLDGRLWIRRVFDAGTPPRQGVVIDPDFAKVDWAQQGAKYGKAVYRQLDEGRWGITVSGDGALALSKLADGVPFQLKHAPAVKDFQEIAESAREAASRVGLFDIAAFLLKP